MFKISSFRFQSLLFVFWTDIPQYMQYFLGGANRVRGYELEKLGKEIFGKNQLMYTLEYRYLAIPTRPIKTLKWTFSLGLDSIRFDVARIEEKCALSRAQHQ